MRTNREIIEEGRRLASEREAMIAEGYNPADLKVPVTPEILFLETGDGE